MANGVVFFLIEVFYGLFAFLVSQQQQGEFKNTTSHKSLFGKKSMSKPLTKQLRGNKTFSLSFFLFIFFNRVFAVSLHEELKNRGFSPLSPPPKKSCLAFLNFPG
jgi:hypothetical protein